MQYQRKIIDRKTWETVKVTKVTQWNVKIPQSHFFSCDIVHLCSFSLFYSLWCMMVSACKPIALIKARCHGIVISVRFICVLTIQRCQPRRSRTLTVTHILYTNETKWHGCVSLRVKLCTSRPSFLSIRSIGFGARHHSVVFCMRLIP